MTLTTGFEDSPMSSTSKIARDRRALAGVLEGHRRKGKTIVFTNGCFDVIHVGHVRLLKFARAQGDILVVGVNDDASVTRLKGPGRPVLPLDQRLRVLAGLAAVDYVLPFEEDTPAPLIDLFRPDVLVKGGDYRLEEVVGHEAVLGWGGRVELAPPVEDASTRGVIDEILKRFPPA